MNETQTIVERLASGKSLEIPPGFAEGHGAVRAALTNAASLGSEDRPDFASILAAFDSEGITGASSVVFDVATHFEEAKK